MIKRGTMAHEILLEIKDNPTDVHKLTDMVESDLVSVRSVIRNMQNKSGIRIQREGNAFWINGDDMPEFGMFAHEKVYIYILEHGSIDSSEVRKMCGATLNVNTIGLIMSRAERDFGVKIESKLKPKTGKRSVRVWSIEQ